MSEVNYSYKVVSVDKESDTMNVIYSSDGLQTIESTMRLPFEHEDVDSLIKSFAPIWAWDTAMQAKKDVAIGMSGTGSVVKFQSATPEQIAIARRDTELYKSDWTQLPDVALSADAKLAWTVYRQKLRDITAQPAFPIAIEWPTSPEQGGL